MREEKQGFLLEKKIVKDLYIPIVDDDDVPSEKKIEYKKIRLIDRFKNLFKRGEK